MDELLVQPIAGPWFCLVHYPFLVGFGGETERGQHRVCRPRKGKSMRYPEEFVPNERLRRARSLKGWSQAEVAEQVGTSFEMVSRWERGVTVPSIYYRERLCAVLGQTPEELGLRGGASVRRFLHRSQGNYG